jgi:hypothetical protein
MLEIWLRDRRNRLQGAYQVPVAGQAPDPELLQERLVAPSVALFASVKSLPDFEWPTIV